MKNFEQRGNQIRKHAKELVLDYMRSQNECSPNGVGVKQAIIFRECGFDFGDYPTAKSDNQQYWVNALIRELEAEGKVVRLKERGPWRLT
ncbi:MAG: hypothetical protein KJO81_08075 [Gammaproteobacteria bacterium]|nr:hypothetical protein [Gammaproteobacteria bacterium]